MLGYRNTVTYQTVTVSALGGGCSQESWSTGTVLWANVYSGDTSESYGNIKGQQFTSVNIVMRYTTTIDKAIGRFTHNGEIVHIETITDRTNRRKELLIKGRIEQS